MHGRASVIDLAPGDRQSLDLVQKGISDDGTRVWLLYSEATGEVYTATGEEGEHVREIFGRVASLKEAQDARFMCPVDVLGNTLVDAARRHLYRS